MTISKGIAEFMRSNLLYTLPLSVTIKIIDVDHNTLYSGSITKVPEELLEMSCEWYRYDPEPGGSSYDFVAVTKGIPKEAKIATPIVSTRNCPNCGGPIRKFGNCEYCGSLIVSERYAEYVS